MDEILDTIIVGGGMVGAATAVALADRLEGAKRQVIRRALGL
ncbi:hypothetical protein [Halomonas urmiana]|nr:hypothetical protein [Halomonas urmiana]